MIDKPTLYLCQLLVVAGLSSNALAQSARDEGSAFANEIKEFRLTEIVELENKIKALEQTIRNAGKSTDTEKSNLQRRLKRLETLLSEYEENSAKRESLLDQFGLTEETLASHLKQYQDTSDVIADLRIELQNTQSELNQSQHRIEEYRASQQSNASSLQESQDAVDSIGGLLITEQQRANTLEKHLALVEQQLKDETRDNDHLNDQLSELQQVQVELSDAQRNIRTKSIELDSLARELKEARQQSSRAIAEARGKDNALQQVANEAQVLNSQLVAKEQQIADLIFENSRSEQRNKELEQVRGELSKVQEHLELTSADLEKKNIQLLRVQQQNQESADMLSAETRNVELQLQQYRDEIRLLAESVSTQKSQIQKAQQSNSLLQDDLDGTLAENKQLINEQAALSEELTQLREERKVQGMRIVSLESDIDQLESDIDAQYREKQKSEVQAAAVTEAAIFVGDGSVVDALSLDSAEVPRDNATESAGNDKADTESLLGGFDDESSWVSLDDSSWYVKFDESGPANYLSFDDVQSIKSQLPSESKCGEFARGFLLDESLEARLSQDGFTVNSFWVVRDNTRLAVCRLQKVANEYRGSVRRQAPSRVDLAIVPVQR